MEITPQNNFPKLPAKSERIQWVDTEPRDYYDNAENVVNAQKSTSVKILIVLAALSIGGAVCSSALDEKSAPKSHNHRSK